jgi:hypothetical protein
VLHVLNRFFIGLALMVPAGVVIGALVGPILERRFRREQRRRAG